MMAIGPRGIVAQGLGRGGGERLRDGRVERVLQDGID